MNGSDIGYYSWDTSAFAWHKPPMDFGNFTLNNILAMAYLMHVRKRVAQYGFSYLASWDGVHRSGKSLSATVFARLLDPTFWDYYEQRVIQEPTEFVDALENIQKLKIHGGVIQVDEAGTSMSSADWYERWMKTLVKMVQAFGYLHPVVFFCAPTKDFVDSRIRKMFHAYYKVERFNNDYTCITPYRLKYNTIFNKWFYKKPEVRFAGQTFSLNRILLSRPPDSIIERYNNLANARKDEMMVKYSDEIKKAEVKEIREEIDPEKVIQFVAENAQIYTSKRSRPENPSLEQVVIEMRHKVSSKVAKYIKMEAERKLKENAKIVAETIGGTAQPRKVDELADSAD